MKNTINTLRRISAACLAITAFFFVSGFSVQNNPGQLPDENAAQQNLRRSKDTLWDDFRGCTVKFKSDIINDKFLYEINYTPKIKEMEGKEITISGFMLPLEPSEKFKHFLLAKYTPTCPFCPPGEPNEVMDIWLDKATAWDENMVKVKGKLKLIQDKELGLFFQIKGAELVK